MASTYLKRDLSVSETIYKWTWSAWVKRSQITAHNTLFKSRTDGNNWCQAYFENDDRLILSSYKNGGYHYIFKTNKLFRDTNAWYHIVLNVDSSQSTAGDRVRIYVNGERETSFNTATNNLSNGDSLIINSSDSGTGHTIGSWNTSNYLDGVLSHVHYSSGYSYAPTVFGSTDSTTGEWKINTSPSFTLGGNGYTVLKDGNTITDQSSNSNDFTLGGGTLTKTEDCPSSVFATLDAIQRKTSALTYSNGNTTVSFPSAWVFALSQWGVSSGKYYWEAKCNSGNNANSYYGICAEMVPTGNGFYNNSQNGAIMYKVGGGETYIDASYNSSGYSPAINDTDIVGLALDLDSGTKTLKIYKNGTLLSSGGTINLSSYYNDTLVFPCFSGNSSSASCSFNVNFGNGYFGTTAVSSAGTNASGIGIFEYDVPTGYTALSTKGLNL